MLGTVLDVESENDKEGIQKCVRFIWEFIILWERWLETNKGKVDGWEWCPENREGKLLLALLGWVEFF